MTAKVDPSTQMMRRRFGAWLKTLREEAGLTQLDVCTQLSYDYPSVISQIERGATALPEHDLLMWAAVLRTTPTDFTKRYAYFCRPFVYEGIFGEDPHVKERLPRGAKMVPVSRKSVKSAAKAGA